ncbi:hypothetical protein [Nocardia fluminea]|uniref:hypothetical protein n=1 Tax=Nocardia fluminea TaxID=134984 RepID=UPI00365284BA
MSDPRAAKAREHHRLSGLAIAEGKQHRDTRNALVRQLRAEDPERWNNRALARAVDCSPELISAILTGRVE